jgi:phosphoglycolate phosphatase-like HAD superfamily hydrolase/adenine/guanine phosphoribosyltransferase-like PRPP-binding protein
MSELTIPAANIIQTPIFPEARQDTIELYPATNALIKAEWVLFDVDDTIVEHDPDAQYWTALHTLAIEHDDEDQFSPDQFALNYAVTKSSDVSAEEYEQLDAYLESVRTLSEKHTGDPGSFERVAQAFKDYPHSGEMLKEAIRTLPRYQSAGPFWEARARMLRESGVPASFGKKLMPGVEDLISQLGLMSKKLGIVSNSRSDLIVPALEELLPDCTTTFTEILALGGSDTPTKPSGSAYTLLEERHSIIPDSCIYIGNAEEDVAFGANAGLPVLILGKPFGEPEEATFIEGIPALVRTLRRHTDGASLFRIATKGTIAAFESDGSLTINLTPAETQAMVNSGLKKFWSRHLTQSVEAYTSTAWSSEYPSLKTIENFADSFGPIAGDIRVNQLGAHPALADYFTDERTHKISGSLSLRGHNYYVCVDRRLEPEERVAVMMDELSLATATLESVDRSQLDPTDLLPYLGVLDNAKQQALSLFHAYTYSERREGIPSDAEYLQLRNNLIDIAERATRSFFEACMGREFTTPLTAMDVDNLKTEILQADVNLHPKGLKLQELDHPLKIMLAAHNLAQTQPFDTVVGFPSGGSQIAIVTALAGETLHDLAARSIKTVYIPLSQHSGTVKGSEVPISDTLLDTSVEAFREALEGRHVMIVDDNSATGSTVTRGAKSIEKLSPSSIRSGVGELDPQRTLIRARAAKDGLVVDIANMEHALFDGASGVVPITNSDVQLRKEYAGHVLGLQSWKR